MSLRGQYYYRAFATFFGLGLTIGRAAEIPPVKPPYYEVRYEASTRPGELALPVRFTLWIPEGAKTLRGVIVHQHGCGTGGGTSGHLAAYDLHWQALARKWDCALLGPAYQESKAPGSCRAWDEPHRGSAQAFLRALHEFGVQSKHPELDHVPWALWGHSGGAFWASLMQLYYPERIAAIFFRSGTAYTFWQNGELVRPETPAGMHQIPTLMMRGEKERHGTDAHAVAFKGSLNHFRDYRAQGALIGWALDPLSNHDCGDSRYLAIPFFDRCLAQRLPPKGSADQSLRSMDPSLAWIGSMDGSTLMPAAKFTGPIDDSVWLPDETFARVWASYVRTGGPLDTTPPPPPTAVRQTSPGELTWSAEVDFESGLGGFIIERDGKEMGRLPEKPVTRYGKPVFQGMTGGDVPMVALPVLRFVDPQPPGERTGRYTVTTVNAAGLRSAAVLAEPPSTR